MNTKPKQPTTEPNIWSADNRKQSETAAAAPEAPLGRCPKCNQPLRYYDGALGYEAARCDACSFERDLNAEANGNPPQGEFTSAAKPAHTPGLPEPSVYSHELAAVMEQRDALLAALKLASHRLYELEYEIAKLDGTQIDTSASDEARAAIAAAEGSNQ